MKILSQILLYLNSLWLGINPLIPQFTEGAVGQPRSFFPHQLETKTDKTISRLIYRGIFKYDIYGSLVPDLAETWSISEDGLVYTVKLKDNQHWSNGKKITADDLIYSAFKVPNLAGVATDKVDELTVRYVLPNKYSPFLSLLTTAVIPNNAEEEQDPLKPVTSGPFHVVRIEKSGPVIKQVILAHEDSEQDIRKLSFRFYANEEEVITAAKLGEIDGFASNKTYEIDNFKEYDFPLQGVYYALFFNLRNEKYQDKELRQALRTVLPVEQLVYEKGITVQGPISRSSFTNRTINFDHYDEKFEANFEDTVVRIVVPDIKSHVKLVEEIADLWEVNLELGADVKKHNPDTIYDEVIKNRDFEILFYGQEVGRDPDRYVNWHSTQIDDPGLNLSGFEQVRADRALEEGRNEPNSDQRRVHYDEFQTVVDEEVPAVFLYHPFSKYYVTAYVEGVGEKYTFTDGDRFLDFSNWRRIKTN